MDKEEVVHIYNGVLFNRKEEHIWISSTEVDEPRAYYTEWGKQKKTSKYHILIHTYGIYKDGTDEPFFKAAVET